MYMYMYMYILGDLALALCVNRWIASCGGQREGRTGKLEQQNAGQTGNLRVFFLRFVARAQ